MNLTVLSENTAHDPQLRAEHGLSLLLDIGNTCILFDSGQSDAFATNAARLGMDLHTVDMAVLSHGHYDHGGGMLTFLEQNHTAPLYVSRHAFALHYNGTEKYIGLDASLAAHPRVIMTDGRTALADGVTLLDAAHCPSHTPVEPYGLTVKDGDTYRPDTFRHEQCLLIEDGGKRILVSGCSHRGVLNWIHAVRPDVFIGGFHFMKLDPNGDGRDTLFDAAETLASFPCRYYTGHCTGAAAFGYLKEQLGDRLMPLYTGASYRI